MQDNLYYVNEDLHQHRQNIVGYFKIAIYCKTL